MCELTPCHHCGVLAGAPASGRLGSWEAGQGASRYGSAPPGVAVFLPASCPRPLRRGSFVYLPFMFSVCFSEHKRLSWQRAIGQWLLPGMSCRRGPRGPGSGTWSPPVVATQSRNKTDSGRERQKRHLPDDRGRFPPLCSGGPARLGPRVSARRALTTITRRSRLYVSSGGGRPPLRFGVGRGAGSSRQRSRSLHTRRDPDLRERRLSAVAG